MDVYNEPSSSDDNEGEKLLKQYLPVNDCSSTTTKYNIPLKSNSTPESTLMNRAFSIQSKKN